MKLFDLPEGWRLKRALSDAIRLHNLRNLNAHSKHFWKE